MRLPPLYSQANPHGPIWAGVNLSRDDLQDLRRRLAVVIGYDTRNGTIEPLGSAFMVSGVFYIFAVTAAHVIFEFAKRAMGPLPRDIFSSPDERLAQEFERLQRLLRERLLVLVVETVDSPGVLKLEVDQIHTGHETRIDIALLRCAVPAGFDQEKISPMFMDFCHPDHKESVGMAGFVSMQSIPIAEESPRGLGLMRKHLVVRASHIAEMATSAEGVHSKSLLWRVPMPSQPGMSGGPLFRLRLPRGEPIFIGHRPPVLPTAIGAVSYHRSGGMLAGYEAHEGETWIVPIEGVRVVSENEHYKILDYQDVEPLLKEPEVTGRGPQYFDLEEAYRAKKARLEALAAREAKR